MVESRQGVKAKEDDEGPVAECCEIEGIAKEERDPIISGDDGPQEELNDIEKNPYWEKGSDRHLLKRHQKSAWGVSRQEKDLEGCGILRQSSTQTRPALLHPRLPVGIALALFFVQEDPEHRALAVDQRRNSFLLPQGANCR